MAKLQVGDMFLLTVNLMGTSLFPQNWCINNKIRVSDVKVFKEEGPACQIGNEA